MEQTRVLVRKNGRIKEAVPTGSKTISTRSIQLDAVIDTIADSKFHILNFKWEGAEKDFPYEPQFRHVRFYYPNAKGGPLFVDMPQLPHEIELCKRKQVLLKFRGYRYLVFSRGMSVADALEELGEWPGQTHS